MFAAAGAACAGATIYNKRKTQNQQRGDDGSGYGMMATLEAFYWRDGAASSHYNGVLPHIHIVRLWPSLWGTRRRPEHCLPQQEDVQEDQDHGDGRWRGRRR